MNTIKVAYRIAVCATILFTIFFRPTPARACSCVAGVTIPDNFSTHDVVFTGKVVRVADNYIPYFSTIDYALYKLGFKNSLYSYFSISYERMYGFEAFFKVFHSWKGADRTFIKVNTGRGGGDCGSSFELGKEYLVYASHAYGIPDNYWVTGICSRNALLADAAEDLSYLNSLPELSLKFAIPIPWTAKDTITFIVTVVILGVVIFATRHIRIRQQLGI